MTEIFKAGRSLIQLVIFSPVYVVTRTRFGFSCFNFFQAEEKQWFPLVMPNQKFILSKPSESIIKLPGKGLKKKDFVENFKEYYVNLLGRDEQSKNIHYAYEALGLTIRDRLMERWKETHRTYKRAKAKRTFYLSMEYLMGRSLSNAMLNLGITDSATRAMYELGIEVEELIGSEIDAGLGNGGLGRLAACFMDSCATLQLPVIGYGLRYEYGMFTQEIVNGEQKEKPDHWLRMRNVWEIKRLEYAHRIKFEGQTRVYKDESGNLKFVWQDTHDVLAVPYDTPIPGFRNNTVNTLRLWKAVATEEFDLDEFNSGDYADAVGEKISAENITMVLYPNDSNKNGKELRLRQQYFLASASLQDVIAHWVGLYGEDFSRFAEKNCFQLNDTHPSIAVAELMRLLMDAHGLPWDRAWSLTRRSMAYTNHTLLPEALEKWPVVMLQRLLPRPMEIIFEINARFLAEVSAKWPGDIDKLRGMSIIEEGGEKQVRMAHLAIVGSFSVNGVAELHSRLLQQHLFADFYRLWPDKFNNKTNGVTPRRWLMNCNPALSDLITETIGPGWIEDLSLLQQLMPYANDEKFKERWKAVKQAAKQRLVDYKKQLHDIDINIDAIFDVQVKRIHEYKRQLLKILHVIHLYNRIKRGETENFVSRCVLIAGKAAPGYEMAKKIIRLVNNVADVINEDLSVKGYLTLVFLPDYRVSAMEVICPGADLSEQISTAGMEASGTGNMKLMMNGAITIGTLDGANIEICREVGDENFFHFGLTEDQVAERRDHYDPVSIIEQDEDLQQVMQLLECGHFNQLQPGVFDTLIESIKSPFDPWMTIADFRSYIDAQQRVEDAYRDCDRWTVMSIANVAYCGKFSSDRTIQEYNREIWQLTPYPVDYKEG